MLLKHTMERLSIFFRLGVILALYLLATSHVTSSADVNYMQVVLLTNFAHIRHHENGMDNKHKAKDFIRTELTRFGFNVQEQEFNINDVRATFNNVIGIIEGVNFGTGDDNIVGIGSHYDTSKNSPGTDDNGSGVTAMLEVARQLQDKFKDTPPRNTILFIAFDKEAHDGTIEFGSRVFLENWIKKWISENYAAMPRPHGLYYLDGMMEYDPEINTQIIPTELQDQQSLSDTVNRIQTAGSRGNFIAVVHRENLDLDLATRFYDGWIQAPDQQFKIETFPLPFGPLRDVPQHGMTSYSSLLKNGHRAFWSYPDIPCVLLTDTAENRGRQQKCHQERCDNVMGITNNSLHFLAKSADVLTNTIYNLSLSELPKPTTTSTSTTQFTTVTIHNQPEVRTTTQEVDRTTVSAPPFKTDAHSKSGSNRNISDIITMFIMTVITVYIRKSMDQVV